jgi:hypothetical protein
MKIKDHVSLFPWPPAWTRGFGDESPPSDKNEEVILRKVELLDPLRRNTSRGHIRLSVELGEETRARPRVFAKKFITKTKPGKKIYIGIVTILRDPEFFDQFYLILQNSIGYKIREIGDFEI